MKLQQFLALPIGTELKGFKKRFVVKSRDVMDGIEQPSLVDIDTAEPLFGAIYVPHLLILEGQAAEVSSESEDDVREEVVQDEGFAVEAPIESLPVDPISEPEMKALAETPFDPMVDVEDYAQVKPAFASDDACLMAQTAEMIKQQPNATQYAEMLKAM